MASVGLKAVATGEAEVEVVHEARPPVPGRELRARAAGGRRSRDGPAGRGRARPARRCRVPSRAGRRRCSWTARRCHRRPAALPPDWVAAPPRMSCTMSWVVHHSVVADEDCDQREGQRRGPAASAGRSCPGSRDDHGDEQDALDDRDPPARAHDEAARRRSVRTMTARTAAAIGHRASPTSVCSRGSVDVASAVSLTSLCQGPARPRACPLLERISGSRRDGGASRRPRRVLRFRRRAYPAASAP